MDASGKFIQNSILDTGGPRPRPDIATAIARASSATGADFAYLVKQAGIESSFNPEAKARSSSATGLYQFIDRTWLTVVDRYGSKHGLDTAGMARKDILNLRKDPEAAALMAAEFSNENKRILENTWGGTVGPTELYLAHFLGAGSAGAFLKTRDENPAQQAAAIFPAAAKANRAIFYESGTMRPKTVDEIYAHFDRKMKTGPSLPKPQEALQVADNKSAALNKAPPLSYQYETDRSVIFNAGFNSRSAHAPAVPALAGPISDLVSNPVDLMLLAQLDLPIASASKARERWFGLKG